MAEPRLIVVGAGPAGLRAAETLVAAGLRPTVIDEAPAGGGQIYRRQPAQFRRSLPQLYGREAGKAAALHALGDALRGSADYRSGSFAWNLYGGRLHVIAEGRGAAMPFDRLIIASGATDRLFPVPGWTLPGVFSLGGAQIALKAQACAIGRRVVLLGTGPLLYLVAYQYAQAGAGVAAVLDTSALSERLAGFSGLATRPDRLVQGLGFVWALRRRRIPIHVGITPLAIEGDAATGVRAVAFATGDGRRQVVDADAVALGFHLRPEAQLADLARCAFRFDAATRQWLPQVDPDGRSSVEGVYLAGDGARLTGADGAEIAGRLAAYAVLADLGRPVPGAEVARLRREQERMERFRLGLARAFPWPARLAARLPDEAIVCRCEAVRAGEIRRAARELDAPEVNRAKAFTRVGMGRCQGRYCGHAAAEIIADARKAAIETVGRLRGQAPVKPLPIAVAEREPA